MNRRTAMRSTMRNVITGMLILSFLTACGGSESTQSNNRIWDESDISEHMGLTRNRSGSSWSFRSENGESCSVAVVLTSAAQVNLYVDAGDTVATNPDKSAGVKIVDSEKQTCFEAANNLLKTLD